MESGKTKSGKMENSIIDATRELERWYHQINCSIYDNQMDDIRIVIQTKGRIKKAIGFFSAKRWKKENGDYISEITVCAEDLSSNDPFEVMLHEMVHAFNNQNGIVDCCSNGYHNKQFKNQAEKHGLNVEKSKTYGFCFTSLNDDGKKLRDEIKPKDELFKTFRIDGHCKQTYLRKFVCDCGMILRVARISEFSATCNNCKSEFKLVD